MTNNIIKLTQGMEAIVDEIDYEKLSRYSWHITKNGSKTYVRTTGLKAPMYMHHMILDTNEMVDHKNGNGLDNRRENLRLATHSLNHANQPKQGGSYSSKFKGVSWNSSRGKWQAAIQVNSTKIFLGRFNNEIDAAKAYDRAALEYFGEFAVLNFKEAV